MTDRGWCPFARQHRGAAAGPFGYPPGTTGQNRPLLFVDQPWPPAMVEGLHPECRRIGYTHGFTMIAEIKRAVTSDEIEGAPA